MNTDNLIFGAAIEVLKKGYRVARKGWNGKGMWLMLVRPNDIDSPSDSLEWGLAGGPQILDSDGIRLLPWIGMKTADGGFVPWLASQTDILAEDWELVS